MQVVAVSLSSPSLAAASLSRVGPSLSKCMGRLWTGSVIDIHRLIYNKQYYCGYIHIVPKM